MDPAILSDLGTSGLSPDDLQIRPIGAAEVAACGAPASVLQTGGGFVIPYFDRMGRMIPFYRIKLFNHDPKYKQPKGSGNHIYFPKHFTSALKSSKCIIITEGEKKAAIACKMGIATVGLGGVYSWRNTTVVLPEGSKIDQEYTGQKRYRLKLPSSSSVIQDALTVALGLTDLVDLANELKLPLVICFDSDSGASLKSDVQRAAAQLGYELRYRGISTNQIKLLVLPSVRSGKTGLDDFIVEKGIDAFKELLNKTLTDRHAFPRHPTPKAFLNQKLEHTKLSRREAQEISIAVLAELDARGRRVRDTSTGDPYFFDNEMHTLMPVKLMQYSGEPMHESKFGNFLYHHYGLSAADSKILAWLATQFTGEAPVDEVSPKRVSAIVNDGSEGIAIQLSDSHFAVIEADPNNALKIVTNGSRGIMFEQDQVEPVDLHKLDMEFRKQLTQCNQIGFLDSWWGEVLATSNIIKPESKELASLLFYISPWLSHWRGIQLPVEVYCGEANSGKSSLLCVRLGISTGRPILRNMPSDLRDWYSSITNTGGLHVTDNVHFTNREIKQRVSDEICRIITAPDPYIEMRKLYTTSAQAKAPVTSIFSFTAISQPFSNSDLLQRSAVFEFNAILQGKSDGDWVHKQIASRGGREAWLAHQMVFLHKFLQAAKGGKWEEPIPTVHRLAHYEKSLRIAAGILNQKIKQIPEVLTQGLEASMTEADWTLEAIKCYIDEYASKAPNFKFTAAEIAEWAMSSEDFLNNQIAVNPRRLGKYIQQHKALLYQYCGLTEFGIYGNKRVFKLMPRPGDHEVVKPPPESQRSP